MQTEFIVPEKKLTKQEYNKAYYRMNKHKWSPKKTDRPPTNVFQLFRRRAALNPNPAAVSTQRWVSFLKFLELLILFGLAGIVTAFLIKEAAGYYLEAHEPLMVAYLKGGLIEVTAVLFSLSRTNHKFMKWAQRITVVILCCFTLCVMSGKLVQTAVGDTTKVQVMRETLHQLESELTQKEQLRKQYLSRGWLTMTRKYERGIDQLRHQIISARQDLTTVHTPQVVMNSLGILISFRFILLVINLICFHRIVEKLSTEFRQREIRS